MNQPIEFVLWNYQSNSSKKFTLKENIECMLIDAKPWKTNQFAFFFNPNNEAKPKMIIYDTEQESEVGMVMNLTGDQEAFLSEVLIADGEKDLVLFEVFAETTEMNIYNSCLNQITCRKEITSAPEYAVSYD